MSTKLKVLILEDSAADTELALHELRRAGFDPEWKRVEREPEYLAQLDQGWEIILADSNLPEFGGLRALDLLRERDLYLPFIIVSGTIGEDKAVAAMKAGANDYIMKDRLARLGPAVERELRDAVERRERMRAVKALQNSEERFRQLSDLLPQIVFETDIRGNLTFANQYGLRSVGYSQEDFHSGINIFSLIAPEDRERIITRLKEILSGSEATPREYQVMRKDGRIFPVLLHATANVEDGVPIGIRGIAIDITERKRAEEALRQAEENYRRSLDESPLGIRIVSAKGETLYANQTILGIYGYDDIEELRSTPVERRYTPESYAEYRLRKKKRMNGANDPSEYEINIIRKTGEIRRLRVFRKEILWNGHKQFQTIYQDITEHKKAEEKLRETLNGLSHALGGIIQVLSASTEKRDPYTAGHQRRVADLARAIGQEMGLAPERVEGLRMAGIIHDIGKISVPAEILSKPSGLTKMEYNLIQCHSESGHDILKDIDFSWPIAEMVFQHHERINGSGYPRGLKGEDILLEARILAVSDVVEAMASHRPYRPALGIEAALKEIEKNKGILYDPIVVSACLTLFQEQKFSFQQNPARGSLTTPRSDQRGDDGPNPRVGTS